MKEIIRWAVGYFFIGLLAFGFAVAFWLLTDSDKVVASDVEEEAS